MPIYEITADTFREVSETSFSAEGIRERGDLQRLLRKQIEIISPDTLIIYEEYGNWEDSNRRIDLLGVDKDANLVVIELKREDGGHMELQAIRYAAMVSTMTFDEAVEAYAEYLEKLGSDLDARYSLLVFLDWEEPNDDLFNKDVRIVLVSAEFSKELTTAVLWLIERDIDILCIRIRPYSHNGSLLVDVQPIIPLPEATDYQVQVRQKSRRERIAREYSRDYTKFEVTINGVAEKMLSKRRAILRIVKHLCASGVTPEKIEELLPSYRKKLFENTDGKVDSEKFVEEAVDQAKQEGRSFDVTRYFCSSKDLIHVNGKTYALCNQWGRNFGESLATLLKAFPDKGVFCKASDAE